MNAFHREIPGSRLSRREFLRLSGLAGGAAVLAACGAPSPTAAPATAAPSGPQALTFKGTLDLWDWDWPQRAAIINEKTTAWSKDHPDIKISYLSQPWTDIETKILTVASAGNGPPISDVHYYWRYELQRANVIAPFPEDFADWADRLSTPFNRDAQGRIRAIQSGWYTDMVYYNKDIFATEGIKGEEIPKKWDDFLKLAQQLTQTDASGKITRVGCSIDSYWQREYLWQGLIYQQGGWLYSEDGKSALWEEEPGVKSLQFIQDWYHTHKVDSPEFPEDPAGFGNGQAAMFIGQGWNTPGLIDGYPDMKDKWDTVPLPTLTGTPTPAWGLMSPEENFQVFMNFPAEEQEAAFAFIKTVMAGEENQVRWANAMLVAPDSKKLLDDPRLANVPGVKSMAQTLPWRVHAGERPLEAEKLWRTMFDKVILEKGDVKAALHEATQAINVELPKKERFFEERRYKPPA